MIESDQKLALDWKNKNVTEKDTKVTWKEESENFRAVLKAARKGETANIVQKDTRTPCPFWDRKFNDIAAERHIKFWKTKAKQNRMKTKSAMNKEELMNRKKAIAHYGRVQR